ncbi:MAG: TAXI family TRAP transporter solute-binding subunit [Proteobacteria bacterium]|nr:TAXI family TRAP transporter solute-binding subunit [Pseudomonadota bacterium]
MRREKWRKMYLICAPLIIASLFLMGFAAGPVSAQSGTEYPKVVRYASLSPGTLLYTIISGLCKVASDRSPMTMIVVPTAGAPTWLPMLSKQGTVDLAMENFAAMWQIWTGKAAPPPIPEGFPDKPPYPKTPNIRILNSGAIFKMGFLVRKDSGMKEVRELKGKRIAWPWTAFPPNVSITLSSLLNGGLTLNDVKTAPMTEVVAAVRAVQEGRIDATVCAVGMGAIAEADALVGVRFLRQSMDPQLIKEGQRAMPGCYTTIQPGGVPGVPENTPLWSAPLANIASTRLPDHVAYKIVETWWNHYKEYQSIHPVLRFWTPETFTNINFTLPYHDGAIKFYKEKGVWTPEMEQKQQQLLAMG